MFTCIPELRRIFLAIIEPFIDSASGLYFALAYFIGQTRSSANESTKAIAMIDKQRISQILAILLDNATKYSKSNQPIEIALGQAAAFIAVEH